MNPGVYILRSLKGGRFYIGSTDDVEKRFLAHNKGLVPATKRFVPFELKIFLPCASRAEAYAFEYRLKKYRRKDILEKVVKDGLFPWAYSAQHKGL